MLMHVELLKGNMGRKCHNIQLSDVNCSVLPFVKDCVPNASQDKGLEYPYMCIRFSAFT